MILSLAGNSLANNLCCDSTTSDTYFSAEILSSHSHWPLSFTILLANSMILFLVGNSSADDLCCGPVDSITSNMFSSQSYRPLRLWSCWLISSTFKHLTHAMVHGKLRHHLHQVPPPPFRTIFMCY
jgi:hypothetical protein